MKNVDKMNEIAIWLENQGLEVEIAKTGSLYFWLNEEKIENLESEYLEYNAKISDHQLISVSEGRSKKILKSSEVENYKILKDGEIYSFADLEKYAFDYNSSAKKAPSIWFPVAGNWSVEKLKKEISKILKKEK